MTRIRFTGQRGNAISSRAGFMDAQTFDDVAIALKQRKHKRARENEEKRLQKSRDKITLPGGSALAALLRSKDE